MIVGVGAKGILRNHQMAIQQIDQSHEVRLYTRELVREAVDVIDTCEQEDGVIFTGSGICDYVAGASPDAETFTHTTDLVPSSICGSISEKMVRGEGKSTPSVLTWWSSDY